MQIHRVRGKDLTDALERAARMYGTEAAVLSQEKDPSGEVTIAVGTETSDPRLAAVGFTQSRSPKRADSTSPGIDRGVADVKRRLQTAGCSAPWIDAVVADLERSGARGTHAIDMAARLLARDLPVAQAPKADGRARLIALVGPTGVGKTTTVAKLADRLSRSGRRVGLVALDAFRAGAVDQLRAYADRLEVPLWTPRSAEQLSASMADYGPLDVALVDTTGRSPRDAYELAKIHRQLGDLAGFGSMTKYLTLQATTSSASLARAWSGFARLDLDGLVLTKLDEADVLGPILEVPRRTKLGVAFLCDGQDPAGNLERPTRSRLVDLLFRRRAA
ncbi:MAG: AAA family ATPase [Planctomycetota bacterium]